MYTQEGKHECFKFGVKEHQNKMLKSKDYLQLDRRKTKIGAIYTCKPKKQVLTHTIALLLCGL